MDWDSSKGYGMDMLLFIFLSLFISYYQTWDPTLFADVEIWLMLMLMLKCYEKKYYYMAEKKMLKE